MDPALLAVLGTLAGVTVTAAAAVITARINGLNQRRVAEFQAVTELDRIRREEKRDASTAFISSYYQFSDQCGVIALKNEGFASQEKSFRLKIYDTESELVSKLKRLVAMIAIYSGPETQAAVDNSLQNLWILAECANAGNVARYTELHGKFRDSLIEVRAAMRGEMTTHSDKKRFS